MTNSNHPSTPEAPTSTKDQPSTTSDATSEASVAEVGEDFAPESAHNPPQTTITNATDATAADEAGADEAGELSADAGADGAGVDEAEELSADTGVDEAGADEAGELSADAGVDGAGVDEAEELSADAGELAAAAGGDEPAGVDEEHLPPGQTSVPVGDEVVVDDETMRRALEAILMVTDEPLPVLTMARAVGRPTGDVGAALEELAAEYTEQGRGFDLREVGGGWRYYTRVEAAPYVERFVLDGQQARLTQAALETLAVIAYKQPVSRARVSAIRGVNVDGVVRTLVARGLVEEAGSDTDSQATLYRTTTYFLERMGMQSLDDLPELAPYLPDMDDIEEELAAQTLPPAPTTDEQPSPDTETGETEAASDAATPTPDTTPTEADETSVGVYGEGAEVGEAEESDAAAAPVADTTSAEDAEGTEVAEVAAGEEAAAPAASRTFAEDVEDSDADEADGSSVGDTEDVEDEDVGDADDVGEASAWGVGDSEAADAAGAGVRDGG